MKNVKLIYLLFKNILFEFNKSELKNIFFLPNNIKNIFLPFPLISNITTKEIVVNFYILLSVKQIPVHQKLNRFKISTKSKLKNKHYDVKIYIFNTGFYLFIYF